MAELGNPKNTIEVLQKYQFHFAKKFGQNFLIDTHVLDKIVRAAEITPEDYVLEIGPGIGTRCLHMIMLRLFIMMFLSLILTSSWKKSARENASR